MPSWLLIVQTKEKEFKIKVGKDEAVALKALEEARGHIGIRGTVTIADRLSLPGQSILSVRIEEQPEIHFA